MERRRGFTRYLSPSRIKNAENEPASNRRRPDGELVWCHATSQSHAQIAQRLADRLANMRPDIYLLLTASSNVNLKDPMSGSVICEPLPEDTPGAADRFLDHWRPDICVWTAGDIKPTLLGFAHRRGIPLYLVDADEVHLSRPGWRWLPTASQLALRNFSMIMTRNSATEHYLRRRIGLRDVRITVTGALGEESKPLPYVESDREELTGLLRGRPVWLAARLHPDEIETVLEANAAIIRKSHRTLLVVAPEDLSNVDRFHSALQASGLRYITWSEGKLPDETTQVILADTPGELGLWYRVAPISFMGCSLIAGTQGSDPNEPAAHGSAILYGPNIRAHLDTFSPVCRGRRGPDRKGCHDPCCGGSADHPA